MNIHINKDFLTSIREERVNFSKFWSTFGGINAIIGSVYFFISILLTIICIPIWTADGWWDIVFSILPNMLGFSIAAYTILWSMGGSSSGNFSQALINAKIGESEYAYEGLHCVFINFIIFQVLALILALISKSLSHPMWEFFSNMLTNLGISIQFFPKYFLPAIYGFSFLVFVYSLSQIIFCVFAIFRISMLLRKSLEDESKKDGDKQFICIPKTFPPDQSPSSPSQLS